MEEADGHARLAADADQSPLRLEEFEAGAEEPAILVGVGIAEHHFLPPAMRRNRRLQHRVGQQFRHDLRCGAQVVDGFEQRDNADAADLTRRFVGKETGELGEKIEAQHICRRLRHRQDEGADCLWIGPVERVADQFQQVEKFARFNRNAAEARQEPEGLRKFRFDPALPFRAPDSRPLPLGERVQLAPDFLQHAVDDRRVLPDVEAHRAETEGFHFPAHRAHQRCGNGDRVHLRQCLFCSMQLGDQFLSVDGLETRWHRLGGECLGQPDFQGGKETAERLMRIAAANHLGLAGSLHLDLDAVEEVLRE